MVNDISSALNAYQAALSRIGTKMPAQEPAPAQETEESEKEEKTDR